MAGEADHFHFAGTFQFVRHLFEGVTLRPVQRILAIFARADAVDVKCIEIAGAEGFKPPVNHREQLFGPLTRMVFGGEKNFLPAFGIFGEPLGDDFFRGAVDVAVRVVKIPDAHGPGDVEIVGTHRHHHAAHAQDRDLRAVLAELAARQHGSHRRAGGKGGLRQKRRGSGERHRHGQGGFKKIPAGSGRLVFVHRLFGFKESSG